MENTREKKLRFIFGQFPKDKQFYVTSDHQAFRQESAALNHAKTLKDKDVKLEKREDYVGNEEQGVKSKEQGAKNKDERSADEREVLFAKHEELFGKKPAANAGLEKLKAKIEAEEARLAEVAAKEASFDSAQDDKLDNAEDADQSDEEE